MPSRRRVVKRIRVRRPTLSDMNAQALMIAKSGVDVVPKLFTEVIETATAAINTFTFANSKDAKMALNVQHQLYNSCATFIDQKKNYKEYRLKQCKVHLMLDDLSGAALGTWTQGAPIKVAYSWQRNAAISDLAGVQYATMAVRPDTIQKVWTINIDKPELWSTCTAGMSGGEGNWLNTSFAPGSAPNTGMYFQPKFDVNLELGANAATGTCGFTYEIEYLVEFRGSVV